MCMLSIYTNQGIHTLLYDYYLLNCCCLVIQVLIAIIGFHINIRRSSFRFLVGFWLLAATVLVNSYAGTLVSSLTTTKLKSTVNSLEDLAASRDLTMTVNVNSVIAQTILVDYYGLMHI